MVCVTLFGVTVWTEYINCYGTSTYWFKGDMLTLSLSASECEALRAIETYKERKRSYDELKAQKSKRKWVE